MKIPDKSMKKEQGEVLQDTWSACYTAGWQGLICPEAFAH
jgi:hypothetical protein